MAKTARKLAMALAVSLVAASPAFAGDQTLLLQIDNRAHVPAWLLQDAREVATEIYTAIGVDVRWLEGVPVETDAAMRVTVVLLSGRAEQQVREETHAFEEVLGFAPRNSGRVYIFGDQLAHLARVKDRPLRLVLGRVMAHEVGHQLLPGQGHSVSGIMRARLDYRTDAPGFTASETASIQALLSAAARVSAVTQVASLEN